MLSLFINFYNQSKTSFKKGDLQETWFSPQCNKSSEIQYQASTSRNCMSINLEHFRLLNSWMLLSSTLKQGKECISCCHIVRLLHHIRSQNIAVFSFFWLIRYIGRLLLDYWNIWKPQLKKLRISVADCITTGNHSKNWKIKSRLL